MLHLKRIHSVEHCIDTLRVFLIFKIVHRFVPSDLSLVMRELVSYRDLRQTKIVRSRAPFLRVLFELWDGVKGYLSASIFIIHYFLYSLLIHYFELRIIKPSESLNGILCVLFVVKGDDVFRDLTYQLVSIGIFNSELPSFSFDIKIV